MKQSDATRRLGSKLARNYAIYLSWRKVAEVCGITTKDGRPNPRMAQMIAKEDYEPREIETRERLHLPPICQECGRRMHHHSHAPEWVERGADVLAELEAKTPPSNEPRVYGRGGKRIKWVDPKNM